MKKPISCTMLFAIAVLLLLMAYGIAQIAQAIGGWW